MKKAPPDTERFVAPTLFWGKGILAQHRSPRGRAPWAGLSGPLPGCPTPPPRAPSLSQIRVDPHPHRPLLGWASRAQLQFTRQILHYTGIFRLAQDGQGMPSPQRTPPPTTNCGTMRAPPPPNSIKHRPLGTDYYYPRLFKTTMHGQEEEGEGERKKNQMHVWTPAPH